jgi:broad specificity phosphatase PhoE
MTAEPLAAEFGVEVELREGLRECNFGAWEGMSWDAIERRFPEESREYLARPVTFTFPGGESLESMRRRVMGELLEFVGGADGPPVAVVTHSGPIRAAVVEVMGSPPEAFFSVEADNCSVSTVERTSARAVVGAINVDPTRMEVVPWRG